MRVTAGVIGDSGELYRRLSFCSSRTDVAGGGEEVFDVQTAHLGFGIGWLHLRTSTLTIEQRRHQYALFLAAFFATAAWQ